MIYIVLEGELEVVRMCRAIAFKNESKDQNRSYIGPDQQGRSINKQEKNSQKQPVRLTFLSSGYIFGEEDVLNGRLYTTTVRCSSNTAILYQIKAKEFINKLYKDDKTF